LIYTYSHACSLIENEIEKKGDKEKLRTDKKEKEQENVVALLDFLFSTSS